MTESDVKIYKPSEGLRKKIGNIKLEYAFRPQVMEKAEKVIENYSGKMLEQVKAEILYIEKPLAELRDTMMLPYEKMKRLIASIFLIKSKAGLCGYPVVSGIAQSMCMFCETRKKEKLTEQEVGIILWHDEAMRFVIDSEITGNGGEAAANILSELENLREKFKSI